MIARLGKVGATILSLAIAITIAVDASGAGAGPGDPAPDFTLESLAGDEITLSALIGKIVVIEWFNPDCPFVRYAHTKGPLKDMGNRHAGDDLVWLAINSGGPGRQGHSTERNLERKAELGLRYPILRDESGSVGRSFGARTTPQIVIIEPDGDVAYRGAIDNAPLGDLDGGELVNYVEEAIANLRRNKAIRIRETRPYGCSIKYQR